MLRRAFSLRRQCQPNQRLYMCTGAVKLRYLRRNFSTTRDKPRMNTKQTTGISMVMKVVDSYRRRSNTLQGHKSLNTLMKLGDYKSVLSRVFALLQNKEPVHKADLDNATTAAKLLKDCESMHKLLLATTTLGLSLHQEALLGLIEVAVANKQPKYLTYCFEIARTQLKGNDLQRTYLALMSAWLFDFNDKLQFNIVAQAYQDNGFDMEQVYLHRLQAAESGEEVLNHIKSLSDLGSLSTHAYDLAFETLIKVGPLPHVYSLLESLLSSTHLLEFQRLPFRDDIQSILNSIVCICVQFGTETTRTVLETISNHNVLMSVQHLVMLSFVARQDARIAELLYNIGKKLLEIEITARDMQTALEKQLGASFMIAWESSSSHSQLALDLMQSLRREELSFSTRAEFIRWATLHHQQDLVEQLVRSYARAHLLLLPVELFRIRTFGYEQSMNAIQRWLSVSQNTQGIHVLYHSAITRAIINSDIQLTEQLLDHADRHKVLLSRETYQKAAEFFKEHGRPDKYNNLIKRLLVKSFPEQVIISFMRSITSPFWIRQLWSELVFLGGGKSIQSKIQFISCLLNAYASDGHIIEALDSIKESSTDPLLWSSFLRQCVDLGNAYRLIKAFNEWMPRYQVIKTKEHYRIVMSARTLLQTFPGFEKILKEASELNINEEETSSRHDVLVRIPNLPLASIIPFARKLLSDGNKDFTVWRALTTRCLNFSHSLSGGALAFLITCIQTIGLDLDSIVRHILTQVSDKGVSDDTLEYLIDLLRMHNIKLSNSTCWYYRTLTTMVRGDIDAAKSLLSTPPGPMNQPRLMHRLTARLYAHLGDVDSVGQTLDAMRSKGIVPNYMDFYHIISGYLATSNFDEALEMLHYMRDKESLRPSMMIYSKLVSELNGQNCTHVVPRLLQHMELDRYIPRRDQVLRIIDACEGCTRSNKDGLEMQLYEWLKRHMNDKLDHYILGRFLDLFTQRGKQDQVRELLTLLENANINRL